MVLHCDTDFSNQKIGSKAVRLQTLKQQGYLVPEFVVLPGETLVALASNAQSIKEMILQSLSARTFAVRSAAVVEDTAQSSMAGQFHTELAVAAEDLLSAITAVVAHARSEHGVDPADFSIIVQEFIEPQAAGVLFTRNPLGGYEMVVEYVAGRGEQVVSGSQASQLYFFTASTIDTSQAFALELYQHGKAIEKLFAFPQDIEWAYANNQLYILQARPITTLSYEQYEGYQYLDAQLPTGSFFFEQSPVTETFSRPTVLAQSLLERAYTAGGPIARAYQSFGVSYADTQQFVTIGNQLYVDKQRETQSLLPAMGYCKAQSSKPKVETFSGLFTSLKNAIRLNRIQTTDVAQHTAALVDFLRSDNSAETDTLTAALEQFDTIYAHIFSINLKSQLSYSRLQAMAGSPATMNSLLENTQPTITIDIQPHQIAGTLVGNSLSLDDTSPFTAQPFQVATETFYPAHWKLKALTPKAVQVQNWLVLRELGRWATVKLVSRIRTAAYRQSSLDDDGLTHHATLAELSTGAVDTQLLKERKESFIAHNSFTFPKTVASYQIQSSTKAAEVVLVSGEAKGVLLTIDKIAAGDQPVILYTEKLTPDLTKYFGRVEGIVSAEGGLLSHLAIMAREAKVPVVVSAQARELLGKEVVLGESEQPLQVVSASDA